MRHSIGLYNPEMDSGLYRVIQSYLAQYPHGCGDSGGGRDEAAVLDAYRVLVEALLSLAHGAFSRGTVCASW
jgi:hypothetical protein